MKLIQRWHERIRQTHDDDLKLEQKNRIRRNQPKNWVSPDDIERLEEQMVPWLRRRRR